MTYIYVYEDVDVCDGVRGGEAVDGAGGELATSGISEMRLCSATGAPSEESVMHTDRSNKNTELG